MPHNASERLISIPLYVRIWLAVVLAVALLTLTAGWILRITAEPPLREVVVRNLQGDVVGKGQARFRAPDGLPIEAPAPQPPGMIHPPGHFGAVLARGANAACAWREDCCRGCRGSCARRG